MAKITVYRIKKFDIIRGEFTTSPSYANLEMIERFGCVALMYDFIEIEAAMIDGNGMYEPKKV